MRLGMHGISFSIEFSITINLQCHFKWKFESVLVENVVGDRERSQGRRRMVELLSSEETVVENVVND